MYRLQVRGENGGESVESVAVGKRGDVRGIEGMEIQIKWRCFYVLNASKNRSVQNVATHLKSVWRQIPIVC